MRFDEIYKGKKVLVTGHTGFKGSWLALWLKKVGANVVGVSLPAPTEPSHIKILDLQISEYLENINDLEKMKEIFKKEKPEIVFHLAAQPLVRYSYSNPVETYQTNVMGTLNILEASRACESVKAIVSITTDKCYENKEWIWGYRENDPMGGHDPYSSSKGCAELLLSSYRRSFFNLDDYGKKHNTLLASVRAGNVIGGGDWADDRLIPDIVKAASKDEAVLIRNPLATRPWQHVLEPLRGYMMIGEKLLNGDKKFADSWNFGPELDANITVDEVAKLSSQYWDKISIQYDNNLEAHHEANLLMLDCSKAQKLLKWKPLLTPNQTFDMTVSWYKTYYENGTTISKKQLNQYLEKMC